MKIKVIKKVVFKDMHGTILKEYEIGTMLDAYYKDEERGYYVTSMGGIYFDEAIENEV